MTSLLQQIAQKHYSRNEKADKTRQLRQKKLKMAQAYFRDSGIMDMWEEIKDIAIANPAPRMLDGAVIPISALIQPYAEDNLKNTGLVIYGKNGVELLWTITDQSGDNEAQPKLHYNYYDGKYNRCRSADKPEHKQKFIASFVRWASTVITPQMLADWGVTAEAPSLVKRSRKLLQLNDEKASQDQAKSCTT